MPADLRLTTKNVICVTKLDVSRDRRPPYPFAAPAALKGYSIVGPWWRSRRSGCGPCRFQAQSVEMRDGRWPCARGGVDDIVLERGQSHWLHRPASFRLPCTRRSHHYCSRCF